MKKSWKWILAAAASAAAFAGAFFLYGALKEQYRPDSLIGTEQNSRPPEESGAPEYPAPDFTVLNGDGEEVQLSDYHGKPVVLNFWASWCYYCKEEMPDFEKAFAENPDVQFLMVNVTDGGQETMESAKKFIEKKGYTFPVFYDTNLEAASAYGASGLPMTVFIGAEGNLTAYAPGMISAEGLAQGLEMITE